MKKSSTPAERSQNSEKGERIAKRLARLGVASRRDAERLVTEGRVAVNGTVLTHPAFLVTESDAISLNGKPLKAAEATRLWRYHKPAGLITAARDPQGRPTIFEQLPPSLPRVVSVGRLDLNSEGLLLLTNDGGLARHLELPARGLARRYRVRVHCGSAGIDPARLKKLESGLTIDGVRYRGVEAAIDQIKGHNAWLNIAIREGKNREVRRIMEHMGWPVSRLIRVAFGPFQLGKLEPGAVEEIPARALHEQFPDYFKES